MFPIARAYATPQQAQSAVQDLIAEGVPESTVSLFIPDDSGSAAQPSAGMGEPGGMEAGQASGESANSRRDALRTGFYLRNMKDEAAAKYMDAAMAGNSIVAVQARFGTSRMIETILDQQDPVKVQLEVDRDRAHMWDPAAPISSAFMLPVRTKRRPEPILLRGLMFSTIPQLTKPGFALFGDGVSRNNPAPLSSMVGMKTLTEEKPWVKSMGFSLLLDKDKRFFMAPTLIDNPAPLSRMLGLPSLI